MEQAYYRSVEEACLESGIFSVSSHEAQFLSLDFLVFEPYALLRTGQPRGTMNADSENIIRTDQSYSEECERAPDLALQAVHPPPSDNENHHRRHALRGQWRKRRLYKSPRFHPEMPCVNSIISNYSNALQLQGAQFSVVANDR